MPTDNEEYRAFVKSQSQKRPSQIFQNRSQEHAAVILEQLFVNSRVWIHLVTKNVNPKTYGDETVIAAARQFLARNDKAEIVILAEQEIKRKEHAFFIALDADESMAARLTLRFVPPDVYRGYKFNFAVNEQQDYRFEPNRESHEALVQFGGLEFGRDLEATFQRLLSVTPAEAKEAVQNPTNIPAQAPLPA